MLMMSTSLASLNHYSLDGSDVLLSEMRKLRNDQLARLYQAERSAHFRESAIPNGPIRSEVVHSQDVQRHQCLTVSFTLIGQPRCPKLQSCRGRVRPRWPAYTMWQGLQSACRRGAKAALRASG